MYLNGVANGKWHRENEEENKNKNKNEFLFWTHFSLYMQAICTLFSSLLSSFHGIQVLIDTMSSFLSIKRHNFDVFLFCSSVQCLACIELYISWWCSVIKDRLSFSEWMRNKTNHRKYHFILSCWHNCLFVFIAIHNDAK